MSHKFAFENLEVWSDAKDFIIKVYFVTKEFPRTEDFGLTSQIRRASISICSNIAEGTSRISTKDQAHFSQIAYASLMECLCQLILARDLGYLDSNQLELLRVEAEKISNKLNALRKYQLNKSTTQQFNS